MLGVHIHGRGSGEEPGWQRVMVALGGPDELNRGGADGLGVLVGRRVLTNDRTKLAGFLRSCELAVEVGKGGDGGVHRVLLGFGLCSGSS